MSESAPDRLARMLAMVAYLRERPAVPVDQVAEQFGISTAQVLADVNTLWVSGTPGYLHDDLIDFSADDLDRGIITLLDPREMDRPLRLSSGEAVALLVALQSLAATLGADHDHSPLVEETIAVLREAAGEAAAKADAIELGSTSVLDQRVEAIRRAISGGRQLRLRYVTAGDVTTDRTVDPLQLLNDEAHWFLVAWCHRAQDVRQFRLDRILDLATTAEVAPPHPEVELRARAAPDITTAQTHVRLELSSTARWVVEQLPGARVSELPQGWIAVTVGVVDPSWLANLVLSLGDQVRSVRPPEIATDLATRARGALAAYEGLSSQ